MSAGKLSAAEQLCRAYDLLPRGGHIVCAVSGGADSVCLLHWLTRLRDTFDFSLTAAHYNHQLRGAESLRDEEFVRSFLQKCCPDVPLVVGRGDVAAQAAQNKTGIEETAREMRYAFLQETAKNVGAQVIATAHNADDNAETVLLHLIRGSALRGLTGIPPRRDNLVRPLLTTRRCEIEEYLQIYGLPHVEDSSNADQRFTRNRVRHQLLPQLECMQPQLVAHLNQTARLLSADEEYLSALAQEALPPVASIPGGLSVCAEQIATQPDALSSRMIRILLDRLNADGGKCSAVHLRAVAALCTGDNPSARVSLPDGLVARRVYDRLELVREESTCIPDHTRLPLPGQLTLPWGTVTARRTIYQTNAQTPCSFYLSCAKVDAGLRVRSRHTGDELARPGRPRRTLKKILIDEKVPRFQREIIPVLECGGRVAAVAGLGADAAFLPTPGEECWQIVCTPNSQTEKGSL